MTNVFKSFTFYPFLLSTIEKLIEYITWHMRSFLETFFCMLAKDGRNFSISMDVRNIYSKRIAVNQKKLSEGFHRIWYKNFKNLSQNYAIQKHPLELFCEKKMFLKKCSNFTRKTPVLESLFNQVAALKARNFIKRDSNTGDFLRIC